MSTANPTTDISNNLPVSSDLTNLSPVGTGGLDNYLRSIQAFGLLSPEREVELSQQFRDQGDLNAAQQLVLCNLRFVVHIARKYQGYGLPLQDIIQEGNIGLMRAVQKFDPSYGVRLISFAAYWIRAEIHEFIMRNWRIVKISTTRAQRKLFFRLRSLFPDSRNNSLTNEEARDIAKKLDVDTSDVIEMEARMTSQDVSLNQERYDEDGSSSEPIQLLSSLEQNPEQSLEEEDWRTVVWRKISHKMSELDERSRDIVKSRWMQDEKATLETLAKKYSVSVERIRQIEKVAIGKLRDDLGDLVEQVDFL